MLRWLAWIWSFGHLACLALVILGGGRCLAHSYSHFPQPAGGFYPPLPDPWDGLEDKQHSTEAFGGGGGGGFEKISTGTAFEALKKNSAGSEMGALRKFPQAAERRGLLKHHARSTMSGYTAHTRLSVTSLRPSYSPHHPHPPPHPFPLQTCC